MHQWIDLGEIWLVCYAVRFLDVGQGDAAVAILPCTQRALVIDVCFADRVLDLLSDEGIGEVVFFLSHSDLDRTRGAIDFLTGSRERGRVLAVVCSRDRISDSSPQA